MEKLKVKDLKPNDNVVFKADPYGEGREQYFDGHVINVYSKVVFVSYLYGYKSMTDSIPYDKMIAKYDKENGVELRFDNIVGESILLEP